VFVAGPVLENVTEGQSFQKGKNEVMEVLLETNLDLLRGSEASGRTRFYWVHKMYKEVGNLLNGIASPRRGNWAEWQRGLRRGRSSMLGEGGRKGVLVVELRSRWGGIV